MKTKAPMTYEAIFKLQEVVMEPGSPYEKTNYQNMLFSYCWQAIDYVDMMKEHGFKADFTLESLPEMIPAIGFMMEDDEKSDGDYIIERLASVKELMAGYLMFTLYNYHVLKGKDVRYKMNDFENGMCLVIHDLKTCKDTVIDIRGALDWAFCAVEYDEQENDEDTFKYYCETRTFLDSIISL